jgi:hypothetical protein
VFSLDDSVSLDDSIQDEHQRNAASAAADDDEANKENVLAETMKTPPRGFRRDVNDLKK